MTVLQVKGVAMAVSHDEIQRQLKAIGVEFRVWGRWEARELEHIIVPGETIQYCLNGRYEGGFAMLCITDQRIVLIDKKPFYLTLEDIRYDMVSEVDYNMRLIDATLVVCTVNKKLHFTALRAGLLRKATAYIQNRVMEFRQQHMMMPAQPAPQSVLQQAQAPQPQQDTQLIQAQVAPNQQPVQSIEHRVINPYTRVPLMMRRRMSRFYS